MSERDELAKAIFIADNRRQSREQCEEDWEVLSGVLGDTYAHGIADGLLAEGWTTRRAVVEELIEKADDTIDVFKGMDPPRPVEAEQVERSRNWLRAELAYLPEDEEAMLGPTAWKLLMNGKVWDYSTHRSDCELWWQKVRSEEPEATLDILPATREEMMRWKER